jgi:hypothetical protein
MALTDLGKSSDRESFHRFRALVIVHTLTLNLHWQQYELEVLNLCRNEHFLTTSGILNFHQMEQNKVKVLFICKSKN